MDALILIIVVLIY